MTSDKKKALGALTLGFGFLLLAFILVKAFYYAPVDEIKIPDTADLLEVTDPESMPLTISIPKIQLESKVEPVGLTADHSMAVPKSYTDVGWFKYGALPGNMGSAVIAGHVDNGLAFPAVFFNLKEVGVGDRINVTTNGNQQLNFTVTKIETLDYNDRNTDVFTENDGRYLKLITCSGKWVSKIRTHDKRLVVTATLNEA
jgi:sortase A